ncbi:MAG: ferritin family protein [Candidatus Kapaibacterium sp.]
MDENKFQEIINFAIELEEQAAARYKDMRSMTKYDSSIKMLKDLERMEREHADTLRNLDKQEVEDYTRRDIPDMKIGEMMAETPPQKNMTYQEVLAHAIKSEEHSKKLYEGLAANSPSEGLRNAFLKLADEEARHKLELETIYDNEIMREM